jgi:hypothetical protein
VGSDRDNTLYEDKVGAVSNGAGDHFFAGLTANGEIRRGLVHFDVSVVPAGSTIEGVVLFLNMSRSLVGDRQVALHRATAAWGEGASDAAGQEGGGDPSEPGDATWVHTFFDGTFWSAAGGDFEPLASASIAVGDEGAYSWGSTVEMEADVSAWVDDPAQNFGWVLVGEETDLAGEGFLSAKRFDTRELGAAGGVGPQLQITFTPPVPVELQGFDVDPD